MTQHYPEKKPTTRWDSFSSEMSDIGTSDDPHHDTGFVAGDRLGQDALDEIYETGRFGRKIVEKPAKDIMRPDIELKDDDQVLFPVALSKKGFHVRRLIRDALMNARQTGGGALLLVVDDGRDLDEPIDFNNIRALDAIQVFDRFDLSVHEYHTDLTNHDEYRNPRLYDFHPNGVERTDETDSPAKVHSDRIIRFEGERIRDFRKEWYNGWGQPVLEAVYQTMKDLGICSDAIASAVHEFQYSVMKIAGLHDLLVENDNGQELLRRRLRAIDESKSMINAVALDASHEEDMEQRSSDIQQAESAYRVLQENFAYDADMPLTVLFGQIPKGLQTNDKDGRQNYFDGLEDTRSYKVAPAIFTIANVLSIARNNEELSDSAMLEMGPLDEISAPDGAEVFAQRADGHAKLTKAGVQSKEMAEERMFDDSLNSRVPENQSRRRRDEDIPNEIHENTPENVDEAKAAGTYRALVEYHDGDTTKAKEEVIEIFGDEDE